MKSATVAAQPEGESHGVSTTNFAQSEGENTTVQPEDNLENEETLENEEALGENYWLALLEYSSGSESDNDQTGSESDNDQA